MHYEAKWRAERERAAFIALDDGAVFHGVAFGARKDALGEVVFNTGMSGYQEILTDPSYAGQFVVLTTAEVGDYGVNADDVESRGLFLSGLVIGDLTTPSNWRSEKSLDDYLREKGVPGIYGVDTRALTLHIREHGNRRAMLCVNAECGMQNAEWAVAQARAWEGLDGQDYAAKVTCENPYEFPAASESNREQSTAIDCNCPTQRPLVVCYDFGVKTNILRSLAAWAKVVVVPAKTPADEPRRRVPLQRPRRPRRRHLRHREHPEAPRTAPGGNAQCTMHNAQCRMQNAECRMHNAQCTMHNGNAECRMRNAE